MSCGCQYGYDCGCGGHDEGLGWLAAISPQDAAEQIFHKANVHGAGATQSIWDNMAASAQAGQITSAVYNTGTCGIPSTGMSNVQLAQMAGGLALTGTQIGLTATGLVSAAALAPWTMGISALIGLFPVIFGHHAAAVKKENSVLCAAVPAANNYLNIIDQAVQSGQVTPQHGIDALNSLYNDFSSAVSSIVSGTDSNSGACNAACVIKETLKTIVVYKSSVYQDLAASSQSAPASVASPVTPARPNVVSASPVSASTPSAAAGAPVSSYASFYSNAAPVAAPSSSLPGWLPIAAVAVGGFLLLRGI